MSTSDCPSGPLFAEKLCEILGIKNERIMKIEIHIEPRDIVRIIIHKAMSEYEGNGILEELSYLKFNGTDKNQPIDLRTKG